MKTKILAVIFLASPLYAATLPDAKLTPGIPNPILTKALICSDSFRTGPYRKVPLSRKKKVFELYGIPWADHSKYEVDHLISLEIGGSNDVGNLWPEPYEPRPGAHEKDYVENWTHTQVCEDKMTLDEAQKAISTDWYSLYQKEFAK